MSVNLRHRTGPGLVTSYLLDKSLDKGWTPKKWQTGQGVDNPGQTPGQRGGQGVDNSGQQGWTLPPPFK